MAKVKTLKTDKLEMRYIEFGSGKKNLVIIPGASITKVIGLAEAVAKVYSCFSEEYTCFLFERTENMPVGYTVSDMANDTAEVMTRLGLYDSYVLGVSQGGMIAQYIAIRHPELVKKAVLASTLCRQNETSEKTFDLWYDLSLKKDVTELNRAVFNLIFSPDFTENNKQAFEAAVKATSNADMERFSILAKACRTFDCYDEIEKIKCPVLAIGSEKDRVLSIDGTKEIARKLGCELYIYNEFCHAVYDMAPDFKEKINNFFKD